MKVIENIIIFDKFILTFNQTFLQTNNLIDKEKANFT